MAKNIFSIEEILTWYKKMLSKGGTKEELNWLLNMSVGLDLSLLHLQKNKLTKLYMPLIQIESLWIRYLEDNIPLQYLVGRTHWRDFELEVSSGVLIPRQETELLIDYALEHFSKVKKGLWVDLGTGSGAIAIALARSLPEWEGFVVDCSESALLIARKNISRIVPTNNIKFYLGNWWDPLESIYGSINLAIANPPYIPRQKIKTLDPVVRNHEPHLALCGGEDGFDCCREIIKGSFLGLSPGGKLFLEHHYDQSDIALSYMNQNGFKEVKSKRDFQGIKRFVCGTHP